MMKKLMISVAASVLALVAQAAEDHQPKHGGVVVETKAGDMELGVIVFFLQIDTVGLKNFNSDKHLQNHLPRTGGAFGAN